MRNFGYFVLVVGMLCIVGALAMDVSVSSGTGRVNNIGLMAERQNFILIGGLMLLVGVIMAVAGKRQKEIGGSSNDCRACPTCAEAIKCAAVKCRHCGSEIESVSNDVRPIAEPMDREVLKLWVARGVMYSIFVGIIVYSLYGK
jgi:hypothetical protein